MASRMYGESAAVRKKIADGYRKLAMAKGWKRKDRAEFLRMAEAWEATLTKRGKNKSR